MDGTKNKKQNISHDEVLEYIDKQMHGDYSENEKTPFMVALLGELFARLSVDSLLKCPVTPESVALLAKFYLMQYKKPILSVILIKKNMMIKDIELLSKGYRPCVSEFIPEIVSVCTRKRVKKCIVIYNFPYKKSGLADIFDLNKVYDTLKDNGISLIDAVCVNEGAATNIIHSINPNTYN